MFSALHIWSYSTGSNMIRSIRRVLSYRSFWLLNILALILRVVIVTLSLGKMASQLGKVNV